MKKQRKSAFTLIELLICAAIVGLLAFIVTPSIVQFKNSGLGKPLPLSELEIGAVVRVVGSGVSENSHYVILQSISETGGFKEPKFYVADAGGGQVQIGAFYQSQKQFAGFEGKDGVKTKVVLIPWSLNSTTNQPTN